LGSWGSLKALCLVLALGLGGCATGSAEKGAAVDGWKLGDRCTYTGAKGTYAANVLIPDAHEKMVALVNRQRGDVGEILKAFYATYEDVFDVLVIYAPNLPPGRVAARFMRVAKPNLPETGVNGWRPKLSAIAPNLQGVILARSTRSGTFRGPLYHEMMHEFGVNIRPITTLRIDSHWGAIGVNGVLGGFDGSTLRCFSPKGAMPPHCDPAPSGEKGRFRVLIKSFGTRVNNVGLGRFAPLELYLMGLLPPEEVEPVVWLDKPKRIKEFSSGSIDTYEVSGVQRLTMGEILAANGGKPRRLLPPEERVRRMAFVLVTEEPADPKHMEALSKTAKGVGSVELYLPLSYCKATGGRSHVRTDL
jgi:hypothetical protein